MTEDQDKLVDLLRINTEMGKCDFCCESCYRFFDCSLPHRQEFYQDSWVEKIARNLTNVRHIISVMSGKGGVGKSVVSANLAVALAKKGYTVAIMDSDLYGPSIPSILGVRSGRLKSGPRGMVSPQACLGIKVISMDFLAGENEPVTWLSDLKRMAQIQFLAFSDYGCLDYLIIDMPPGTGSETVNLLKYLPRIDGTIIVTTPSDVAEQVVNRCITLCHKAKLRIIGFVENMSSLTCPECGKTFYTGHGSADILARGTGVPLLGRIARDPLIVESADRGTPFLLDHPDSDSAKSFFGIASRIEEELGDRQGCTKAETSQPTPDSQLLEIIEINASHSCYGKSCYYCDDYFLCTRPRKDDYCHDIVSSRIEAAMKGVRHKVAVMSCKGGVGKSTVAANLSAALALRGRSVTILDCDFHGPCIPKILGVGETKLKIGKRGIVPATGSLNIGIVSVAFLLEADEPVTWFDSLKKVTVEQFLANVNYGSLDYLIIDLPPGTGAESYGLLQHTPGLDGTVIITLPSESPRLVARRSVGLCRQAKVPVLGIIENMSRFVCPECNAVSDMCGSENGQSYADSLGVPFLGDIPLDTIIAKSCDEGVPFVVKYPESVAARSLLNIVDRLEEKIERCSGR